MRSWLRAIGFVIIGMAAGIGLGVYLGWFAWPTEYTDANPSILQATYQHDYIKMIAAVYADDGNLPEAQRRIASLGENGGETLFSFTLDTILRAGDEAEIRQLVLLSADLGYRSPAMEPYLAPPASATEPADGE